MPMGSRFTTSSSVLHRIHQDMKATIKKLLASKETDASTVPEGTMQVVAPSRRQSDEAAPTHRIEAATVHTAQPASSTRSLRQSTSSRASLTSTELPNIKPRRPIAKPRNELAPFNGVEERKHLGSLGITARIAKRESAYYVQRCILFLGSFSSASLPTAVTFATSAPQTPSCLQLPT
jgi:hypothetical protein